MDDGKGNIDEGWPDVERHGGILGWLFFFNQMGPLPILIMGSIF
jgi:hypothetical protein